MRKLFVCALMLTALLAFREAPTQPAFAQGKEDKGVKKGKVGEGTIEIAEGKDGKYRFFVRDADAKLLAMSGPGGFETVKDAQKAVDTLKDVIKTAKVSIAKKGGKSKDKK
jgi:hypothetical protein